MKNIHINEKFKRQIEWTIGGRIVHKDLEGNILGIENYTKASLSKIMHFLGKKEGKTKADGMFNSIAKDLLNGIDGFRIEKFDDSFFGIPADKKVATNKIHRSICKSQTITKMYCVASQNWKLNTRYQLIVESDGSVQFEEYEAITPENLNQEYSIPLFNVYESLA